MKKTVRVLVIITLVLVLMVGAVIAFIMYRRYSPGKTHGDLTSYFGVSEGQVAIVLQDELSEYKGVKKDGHIYIPVSLVSEHFNDKFYWDNNDLVLVLTTPTEIITATDGRTKYSINDKNVKNEFGCPVVILNENSSTGEHEAYVSIEFAEYYSPFEYQAFENPDRVLINYNFDVTAQYAEATKDVPLRKLAGIKSDILEDVKKGDRVMVLDGNEDGYGFIKIMSGSGVIGYARGDSFGATKEEGFTTDYVAPEYSHTLMDETVKLGFHQVASVYANSDIDTVLANGTDINVICPTWFQSSDNNGNIQSFAEYDYVDKAHNAGIQVWGLCDDFSNDNKIGKVLSSTSSRKKLEKNLVSEAIKYSLDGLNIDFEYVTSENGIDFVQFIRELSVMCRKYELVLSIDNYPLPMYTAHYNRTAQAEVADYIITMAYDEYVSQEDGPGPNSSLTYVNDAIAGAKQEIPDEQSIIALPLYCRFWAGKKNKVPTPETYGMKQSYDIVANHGINPEWDEATSLYYATYEGSDGKTYQVWLETVDTLELKFAAVKDSNAAGVAFWKLGLEDSDVWNSVKKSFG
ncbi:MAG: hypothetical protein K6G11_01680 [Lachnospiraceae bacterium]|nr:hypothetical protein [Lachnospiraceae bacterium]